MRIEAQASIALVIIVVCVYVFYWLLDKWGTSWSYGVLEWRLHVKRQLRNCINNITAEHIWAVLIVFCMACMLLPLYFIVGGNIDVVVTVLGVIALVLSVIAIGSPPHDVFCE